jgi:hypothetical protein
MLSSDRPIGNITKLATLGRKTRATVCAAGETTLTTRRADEHKESRMQAVAEHRSTSAVTRLTLVASLRLSTSGEDCSSVRGVCIRGEGPLPLFA